MAARSEPDENSRLVEKREEKDKTWFAWIWQVVVAGTGFLADAYDLFVIDLVMSILLKIRPEQLGPWSKSMVASATLVGAVIGQILFGFLGDWFGRKMTFIVTCFMIIAGTILSGCVIWTDGGFSLVYQLSLCRLFLGIGVGGEYPLAATIASEGSMSSEGRGQLIAAVFSMQGWGMFLSCLVVLTLLWFSCPLEYTWRIALIAGSIPSIMVIGMRARLEESTIFTEASEETGLDKLSLSDRFSNSLAYMRQFWHPLVGTTMTWLLLDVTFYGTGSFKTRISGFLVEQEAGTPEQEAWNEAVFATICVCMAIPGYLLAVAFMERIGRYNLQLGGFIMMAINFGLIAVLNGQLPTDKRWLLVIFFGLTFLFANFGPNTTTFVLPVEVYPTLIRSTCHGISAAAGKIGAVIGVVAFSPCEAAFGLEAVLYACGVVCITGAVFTFFFTQEEVIDLRELDKQPLSRSPAKV